MDTMERIWKYMMEKLFCNKTKLFYDFALPGKEGDFEAYLPSIPMIKAQIPNPCGWGSGMEDGMIIAGVMLEAAIECYEMTNNKKTAGLAKDFFEGMKTCASVSESEGFLARSVSPVDGKSHYIDSSRDQYTHWIFSAAKLFKSTIASDGDRKFIKEALCAFASRARKNVTAENAWNLMREDGGRGIVTTMWQNVQPHEVMRLPMFYLAAWKIGGDKSFKKAYFDIRDSALTASEKVVFEKYRRPFALNQMQLSLRFVYDHDEDEAFRTRCLKLMKKIADFGISKAEELARNIDRETIEKMAYKPKPWDQTPAWFMGAVEGYAYYAPMGFKSLAPLASDAAWLIRDIGDAASLYTKLPGAEYREDLMDAILKVAESICYDEHYSDGPCYLLAPYYALLSMRR